MVAADSSPSSSRRSAARSSRSLTIAQLAVGRARPLLARAVAVELDAVAVGVAQVDRLADAVVARAVERDARVEHAAERVRERPAVRVADRRRGRGPWCSAAAASRRRLPRVQPDVVVVAARRDEGRLVAEALLELEAEHAALERERPVDVRDLEVDVPDVDARVDRHRRKSATQALRRRAQCVPTSRSSVLVLQGRLACAAPRRA